MTSYIILCKTFHSPVRARLCWYSFNNLLEHFILFFHFYVFTRFLPFLRNACEMSLHLQKTEKQKKERKKKWVWNMDIVSNGRYVFCGCIATRRRLAFCHRKVAQVSPSQTSWILDNVCVRCAQCTVKAIASEPRRRHQDTQRRRARGS